MTPRVKSRIGTTALARQPSSASRLDLVAIGDGVMVRLPLPTSGEVSIGRGTDVDARIDAPSISRRHALLRIDGVGGLTVEDLGSANGTNVRGAACEPGARTAIKIGEVFDLGSILFAVQHHAAAERPRKVWSHAFFEAHLEEQCLRAGHTGASFAVLALRSAPDGVDAIARAVRPIDIVGEFVPGEYEIIVLDVAREQAEGIASALARELGAGARVGTAMFPGDGRDRDALIAAARVAIGGDHRAPAPTGGAMRELHRLVERIAPSTISVLILGETGVGKEVLAESVHRASKRADRAFLQLNCAALSETLLESELFGHERGAFTGAVTMKPGLLETADGGTVFLDEVGEIPMALQAKLLRVIEERAVLRVGGLKTKGIDVRFVAATNRDLEAAIKNGTFRQDLYFRLNGISLVIPPLRERVDEIASLARLFIAAAWKNFGREDSPPRLSPEAFALLKGYAWPGNIRELRNVIERAVLLCSDGMIGAAQLPADRMRATTPPALPVAARPPQPARPLAESVRQEVAAIEKQRILDALAECAGNQTHAARLLEISRATLVNKLDAYGIKRPRKR